MTVIPLTLEDKRFYLRHILAVPVICMNMLKILLRMFVSMVAQIYLLHLHVINLRKRFSSFYFKDNWRFLDMTLRPMSSSRVEITDKLHSKT